jgi:dCMP deaminase
MRMAEELAKRSTCARLQVGTVLADARLENVVAIGYNGNARGFPNRCDSTEPGKCGCIHSEQNALVKAPGTVPDKVAFVTASPCVMCAKLMIQSGITHLFYRTAYRSTEGIDVLRRGGIEPVEYTRWADAWRTAS